MPDLVDECSAAPVAPKSPLLLLEEVLLGVLGGLERGLLPGDLDRVTPPPPAQAALGHDHPRLVRDAALDRRHQVGLVVDCAREPGHDGLRHELANEDDAAAIALPDVEAEVDLRKIAKTGPRNAPDARVDRK